VKTGHIPWFIGGLIFCLTTVVVAQEPAKPPLQFNDALPLWQQKGLAYALADDKHQEVQFKAVHFLFPLQNWPQVATWLQNGRDCQQDCNLALPLLSSDVLKAALATQPTDLSLKKTNTAETAPENPVWIPVGNDLCQVAQLRSLVSQTHNLISLPAVLPCLDQQDIFIQAAALAVIAKKQSENNDLDENSINALFSLLMQTDNEHIAQFILQIFNNQSYISLNLLQTYWDDLKQRQNEANWPLVFTLLQFIARHGNLNDYLYQDILQQLKNSSRYELRWAALYVLLKHQKIELLSSLDLSWLFSQEFNFSADLLPCVNQGLQNDHTLYGYNVHLSGNYKAWSVAHSIKNNLSDNGLQEPYQQLLNCLAQQRQKTSLYEQTLQLMQQHADFSLILQKSLVTEQAALRLLAIKSFINQPLTTEQESALLKNLFSDDKDIRNAVIVALLQQNSRKPLIFFTLLNNLLEPNHFYQNDTRFLYHMLAGDDALWHELLLLVDDHSNQFNIEPDKQWQLLNKINDLWTSVAAYPLLTDQSLALGVATLNKTEVSTQNAEKINALWKTIPEGVKSDALVKANQAFQKKLLQKQWDEQLDTLFHWAINLLTILAIHFLAWWLLLAIASHNQAVRHKLVWHPVVRKLAGFGYIGFFISQMGFLQRLLLRPFLPQLRINPLKSSYCNKITLLESQLVWLRTVQSVQPVLYLSSEEIETSLEYAILQHFPPYTHTLGNRHFLLNVIRRGGLDIILMDSQNTAAEKINAFLGICQTAHIILFKRAAL